MREMSAMLPSIQRLTEAFSVGENGDLIWRIDRGGAIKPGKLAGRPNTKGYLQTMLDGSRMMNHRIVWAITFGEWPIGQIDHINCNKTDNRPSNLREATTSQNACNRRLDQRNKSGIKGVFWNERRAKWLGYVDVAGRRKNLGAFLSKDAAAAAVRSARAKYHGEFARA